jgi:hypothetical protein
MPLDPAERARLNQLAETAGRELEHLQITTGRLFADPFTAEELEVRCRDVDFAERLDAFVARFGRLQDLLGDKLLPAWLKAMQEPPSTVMEMLDRAEKLGVLRSADEWVALRKLRNRMVHEYLWQYADLHRRAHGRPARVLRP